MMLQGIWFARLLPSVAAAMIRKNAFAMKVIQIPSVVTSTPFRIPAATAIRQYAGITHSTYTFIILLMNRWKTIRISATHNPMIGPAMIPASTALSVTSSIQRNLIHHTWSYGATEIYKHKDSFQHLVTKNVEAASMMNNIS